MIPKSVGIADWPTMPMTGIVVRFSANIKRSV